MAVDVFTFERIKRRRKHAGMSRRKLRKPAKWLHPRAIEREYQRHLGRYANNLSRVVNEIIVPELPALVRAVDADRPGDRKDVFNWATEVADLVEEAAIGMEPYFDATIVLVEPFAFKVSEYNQEQWQKVLRSVLGVDVFVAEPWLESLVTSFRIENVKLIKDISDKALNDIEGLVQRGLRAGQRHEELAKQIQKVTGFAKTRSQIIARDQISKLNGNLTRLRQSGLGIKKYIWQTSLDERVRPTHAQNEGVEFKWNDPPGTGNPGEDVLCRCTGDPVFESSSGLAGV